MATPKPFFTRLKFIWFCICTQTRTAYSFQTLNNRQFCSCIIFQSYLNYTLFVIIFKFVFQDITFVVQNFSHTLFQIRSRNFHNTMICHLCITNSC